MRWQSGVRIVAATLVAGVLGLPGSAPAAPAAGSAPGKTAQARPNVVMIMTDDQPAKYLSVMPNTRRLLGEQGTTFSDMTVTYSLCCPSRATYLTGQTAHNHGVLDNKLPAGGYEKLRGGNTLPVWLTNSGYHTAHVGKYLNGYGKDNPTEVPPGWGEWHALVGGSTYEMYGYQINHNGNLRRYGQWDVEDPQFYQTDVLRKISLDYVGRRAPADKPFFLSVAPLASHVETQRVRDKYDFRTPRPAPRHKFAFRDTPLPKPDSFNEPDVSDKPAHIRNLSRFDDADLHKMTRRYRAQLESLLAVDEMVGAIVNKLRDTGELANTVIMFTSDNGYLTGHHRIREGKIHPYEPSLRVPLLVRGPGFPAGRTIGQSVTNLDWAPTILDLANTPPGLTQDGRSLLQLLANPTSGERRHLLIETGPKGTQRWYRGVRTPRYTYVKHSTGELELYDRQEDPQQLRSRHNDPAYQPVRDRLAQRLRELHDCSGRACWGIPAATETEPVPLGEKPGAQGGGKAAAGATPSANSAAGGTESGAESDAMTPTSDSSLPVTGLSVGGTLLAGMALVGAGLGLRSVRRRRRA
ncbi:MAG: sulfatase family protein [Micromonosporaceae bacterium]